MAPSRDTIILTGLAAYGVGALVAVLLITPGPCEYPALDLASHDGGQSFRVEVAEADLEWEDFHPMGCNRRPSGSVDVGDELTGCAGSVVLQYSGLEGEDC